MAIQLPAEVTQASQKAQDLLGTAGQMSAAEPSVSDILRQKVQEAYAQNQDIIKPLDVATQDYLTAPKVAREKYQDIFNPFARENLVSQYQASEALPMLSLSSILGNRMGRIEDTLGAGVRGYQAATAAAAAKAAQAQQAYENAFNEFKTLTELDQAQQRIDETSSGGGSLFDWLFGGGDNGWDYLGKFNEIVPGPEAMSPFNVQPGAGAYSPITATDPFANARSIMPNAPMSSSSGIPGIDPEFAKLIMGTQINPISLNGTQPIYSTKSVF